jgi:anhydro-N-acetylmuramic acid kinase
MAAGDAPLFLGLISGTSADAIDAVVAEFEPRARVLHAVAVSYAAALRAQVLAIAQSPANARFALDTLGELDVALGEAFAAAALQAIAGSGVPRQRIRAIGSHGQTVRHRPRAAHPFTWQMGDPHVIAERTGIAVVADFRRRDVAAGGEGAPLLPALHAALLADANESRAVLNLGGIANLTLLPRAGEASGFDTGTANALLDAWSQHARGIVRDDGGAWAAGGRPDAALLARLLDDPYFARPAPKSTGREHFNLDWLRARLGDRPADGADVAATLVEFSARTIVDALRHTLPDAGRVIACGGGVHNGHLMRRLAELLGTTRLETTAAHGIDPDFVEALGFAWLARETVAGRAGNLPRVTGARGPRVLGAVHPA